MTMKKSNLSAVAKLACRECGKNTKHVLANVRNKKDNKEREYVELIYRCMDCATDRVWGAVNVLSVSERAAIRDEAPRLLEEKAMEPMSERQRDFLLGTVLSLKDWSRSRKEGGYDCKLLDDAVSILRAMLKGQELPCQKDSGLTFEEIFIDA